MTLDQLKEQYNVLAAIDLDAWYDNEFETRRNWMRQQLLNVHKDSYELNERIVFVLSRGDVYDGVESPCGYILHTLQTMLNEVDISNFFVILLTNDQTIKDSYDWVLKNVSTDPVPITIDVYSQDIVEKQISMEKNKVTYSYNSVEPYKIPLSQLGDRERELLTESKTFCMYPWTHLHAYPNGRAYPCCMANMNNYVGNTQEKTMKEIWNDEPMRRIRRQMLNNEPVAACTKCYEQEQSGFFSGRLSANKHHGHHIKRIHETDSTGRFDRFEMTYWDIRFSNLCNLSCRSCGHIFSSSWYQDQLELGGPEWKKHNKVLFYAGRSETDMWEQLIPHLDYVEQIYFAGGEPLLMKEHYNILDELVRRGKFDVRLVYNTNFTHTRLKDRTVFDYWKQFRSVSVGASLDDQGSRAEYIRKGTDWDVVVENRRKMLEICPEVDFYISPTLSIFNVWTLPDFHRTWVEQGLIRPQDLNVNCLQDPVEYRIDIAPQEYKKRIVDKYNQHIEWLKDKDQLNRATTGFQSAINFINSNDNSYLIDAFWKRTNKLDGLRKERALDIIPELAELK